MGQQHIQVNEIRFPFIRKAMQIAFYRVGKCQISRLQFFVWLLFNFYS